MRITHLRSFTSLARTGSLTKTAQCLNYSRSSINYHIRVLEQEFGAQLLNRCGDHIELTPFGRRLLPSCRDVVVAAERLTAVSSGQVSTPPQQAGLRLTSRSCEG